MRLESYRIFVCQGCVREELYQQLRQMAQKCTREGTPVQVRQAICLGACRFKEVVKVQHPDGHITNYSTKALNGFQKWSENPIQQLLDEQLNPPSEK